MNKVFTHRHPELWKFIKFNFSVLITSALDIISYMLLLYFIFKPLNSQPLSDNALLSLLGIKYKGYLYAYLISTSIGYISAYLINRKITFHSDINPAYSSIMYIILAAANVLISSYLGGIFGSFITARDLSSPLVEMISKFIIINIPTIWTYPIERYIIQIRKKEKNNMIIATDLDGTLLKNDTTVSNENLEAIQRLSKRGIKTVLLTGRTLYEIPDELRSCKGVEYFVYSNGAGINHSVKGITELCSIEKSTAIKVFDILSSYETFIELYSNGHPTVEKSKYNDEGFEYYKIDSDFIPEMHRSRIAVKDLKKLLYDDAYKIEMFDVFFRNENERMECKNRLSAEFDGLEITTSMDNNLEIMNKGINKGYGLRKLCQITGISLDNIIVIGDSKNDITAFTAAKKKFAVANACSEIKSIADRIICSNEEHIMCYIEKECV